MPGYCFFRSPRTQQERRASIEGFCRPRRNWHNLPTSYDDLSRTTQRTWKEHRRTQWKLRD